MVFELFHFDFNVMNNKIKILNKYKIFACKRVTETIDR